MVQCIFYQMDKRQNSTARPNAGTNQIRKQGEIKQPFDIINPQIAIIADKIGLLKNPVNVNYVKIGDPLNRYYFINNWTYDRGVYTASCEVDTLASFANNILQLQQYVVRSSSNYDGNILDTEYAAYAAVASEYTYSSVLTLYDVSPDNGSYIIGVMNNQLSNKYGSAQYYIMNYYAIQSLMASLFGENVDWLDVSDVSNNLLKALFNPLQYFVSCYWLPITFTTIRPAWQDPTPTYHFGYWHQSFTQTEHYKMYLIQPGENDTISHVMPFPIPKHQDSARGAAYNTAAFNSYALYLQPFGLIELDADQIGNANYLLAKITIDVVARKARLQLAITNTYGDNVGSFIGCQYLQNFGIDLPISSVTINNTDAGSLGAVAIAGNLADKADTWLQANAGTSVKDITGYSAANLAKSYGAINSNGCTINTVGAVGSKISYSYNSFLIHKYKKLSDQNFQERGRPCCKRLYLDTLSGYVQCQDADVWSVPATYAEKQIIRNHLNNGIHIQ